MRPLVRPRANYLVRPLVRPLVSEGSGGTRAKIQGTKREEQGQEGGQELNSSKLPYVYKQITTYMFKLMETVTFKAILRANNVT